MKSSGKSSGLRPRVGSRIPRKLLVRMGRLELPRPCERWNLNPVRLPIPPHPLAAHQGNQFQSTIFGFVCRNDKNSCGLRVSCGKVATTFWLGSRIA